MPGRWARKPDVHTPVPLCVAGHDLEPCKRSTKACGVAPPRIRSTHRPPQNRAPGPNVAEEASKATEEFWQQQTERRSVSGSTRAPTDLAGLTSGSGQKGGLAVTGGGGRAARGTPRDPTQCEDGVMEGMPRTGHADGRPEVSEIPPAELSLRAPGTPKGTTGQLSGAVLCTWDHE